VLGSMRPLLQIWRGTALRRNSIGSTQFNFLQEQRKRGSHRLRAAPVRLRNSEGWESMDGGGLRPSAKKAAARSTNNSSGGDPPGISRLGSDNRVFSRASVAEDPRFARRKENCKFDLADRARGSGLAAVSQSPDGKFLACGGSNVLALLHLGDLTADGGRITERASWGRGDAKQLQDVKDVRWHPSSENQVACSSGGTLTLFNVGADSMRPVVQFEAKSHSRTIWRIAWCQPSGSEQHLLSGGLDGTIRLWDTRGSCQAVLAMSRHSAQEKVRDIRVSGAEPHKFAVGLENNNEGAIAVWDLRKPDTYPTPPCPHPYTFPYGSSCGAGRYVLKIKEETPVLAVDWHPALPTVPPPAPPAVGSRPGGAGTPSTRRSWRRVGPSRRTRPGASKSGTPRRACSPGVSSQSPSSRPRTGAQPPLEPLTLLRAGGQALPARGRRGARGRAG